MSESDIQQKFGGNFVVNKETYIMGVHHLLSDQIARKFKNKQRVVDACVGAGFMTIALAKYVTKVIAIDINEEHLHLAKENARRAGVSDKVEFILGDTIDHNLLSRLGDIDGAFLDPDWSSGDNKEIHTPTFKQMQPPGDTIFNTYYNLTPNIAVRLPKEFDLTELSSPPPHRVEESTLNGSLKFYTAYFGDLA